MRRRKGQKVSKVYCYSAVMAKIHGLNAAIILQMLSYQIEHSGFNKDGKRWFFHSVATIHKMYKGLMSKPGVRYILDKLCEEDGPLVRKVYRGKGVNRTYSYAFKDSQVKSIALQVELRHFAVQDALEHNSIPLAIIIHNFQYLVRKNCEKYDVTDCPVKVSITDLAGRIGLKREAVSKILKKAVKNKVFTVEDKNYSFVDHAKYVQEQDTIVEKSVQVVEPKEDVKIEPAPVKTLAETVINYQPACELLSQEREILSLLSKMEERWKFLDGKECHSCAGHSRTEEKESEESNLITEEKKVKKVI